jgi:hypothetical protein
MSSNTFTLTGNSSKLCCSIFPEVVLDDRFEYTCALLELTTYHSIPNVNESNNKFCFYATKEDGKYKASDGEGLTYIKSINIDVGSYEADEILRYIKRYMNAYGFSLDYTVDKNTFKLKIKCSTAIYVGDQYSDNVMRKIFGFAKNEASILPIDTEVEASDIIKIANQDVVRVECNIVSGSYVNGKSSHTIYEFATQKVDVGYKIIERPRNLIYMPVTTNRLNYIEITLADQNGEPIDFRGETVTCRIHVKKV